MTQKKRGTKNRKSKKVILVGLEGKNVTEKLYLNQFNRISSDYSIVFAPGNKTDPIGIINETIRAKKESDLDLKKGDICCCLLDTDVEAKKKDLFEIIKKKAEKSKIEVLFSNPTFEIWYILHFNYTTKVFESSNSVIEHLKNYIPEYKKNSNVSKVLLPKKENAISNSKRLERFHKDNGKIDVFDKNPYTDVYKLIEKL